MLKSVHTFKNLFNNQPIFYWLPGDVNIKNLISKALHTAFNMQGKKSKSTIQQIGVCMIIYATQFRNLMKLSISNYTILLLTVPCISRYIYEGLNIKLSIKPLWSTQCKRSHTINVPLSPAVQAIYKWPSST